MADASLSDVLPLRKDEFRLVNLSPKTEKPLHVELFKTNLSSPPPYEALSYVWGARDAPQHIFRSVRTGATIKGLFKKVWSPRTSEQDQDQDQRIKISVTLNLYYALQHLQRVDSHRVLWVDALCIDQDDMEERSMQVRIMFQIFSKASSVQAWLGPAPENFATLLSKLSSVMPCNACGRLREVLSLQEHSSRPLSQFLPAIAFAKAEGLSFVADMLNDLFGRDWFKRVWILQEAAANRQLRILYGSCTVDWNDLLSLGWFVYRRHGALEMRHSNSFFSRAMRLIEEQRAPFSEPPQLPTRKNLSSIFAIGSGLQATDPRDHVYAMLNFDTGILDGLKPLPDYTLSLKDTCRGLAMSLQLSDGARMLHYTNPAIAATLELPSWTPIFLSPRIDRIDHTQKVRAMSESSRISALQTGYRKTDVLMVRGDLVSSIKWLSKVYQSSYQSAALDLSTDLIERLKLLAADTSERTVLYQLQSLLNLTVKESDYKTFSDRIWSVEAWSLAICSSADPKPEEYLLQLGNAADNIASLGLLTNTRIDLTADDDLCLVPMTAQVGDMLVSLTGTAFPMVLRRQSDFDLVVGVGYIAEREPGIPAELIRSLKDYLKECSVSTDGFGPGFTNMIYHSHLDSQVGSFMRELGWQMIDRANLESTTSTRYAHPAALRKLGQKVDAASLKKFEYHALLNPEPLPEGWKYSYTKSLSIRASVWTHKSGVSVMTDPRMSCLTSGPIIEGWRVLCVWKKTEYGTLRRVDYFFNIKTGELTTEDPCLGPRESLEGLKAFVSCRMVRTLGLPMDCVR